MPLHYPGLKTAKTGNYRRDLGCFLPENPKNHRFLAPSQNPKNPRKTSLSLGDNPQKIADFLRCKNLRFLLNF